MDEQVPKKPASAYYRDLLLRAIMLGGTCYLPEQVNRVPFRLEAISWVDHRIAGKARS